MILRSLVQAPLRITAAGARGVASALVALALAIGVAGCGAPTAISVGGATSEAASSLAPTELDVSAASSLKKVLTANAVEFERANNANLVFNFGASGQLVKQIEGGAPADVFVSASPSAVGTLAAEGLVSAEDSVAVAGNRLVILVPKDNPAGITGPADLTRATRLATGDPATAPHGQKAVEWLTGLGTWDAIRSKFVFAANAAQTDDYVARGEVDAGIGFASDAAGRDDLEIAYTVPDGQIKKIVYVGAPVTASTRQDLARAYLAYLLSHDMQTAFEDGGFTPASSE